MIHYISRGVPTFPSPAGGPAFCLDIANAVLYVSNSLGGWVTGIQSAVNSLTAFAGGGQASGTPLTALINRVSTVATIADSVKLPASFVGLELTVVNAAANSMNVFPSTGDAINAIAANGAFAVAGGKTATFYCTNSGQWHSILSA